MIKVKYNIGSKPHIQEFKTESKFVEWIIDNFKHKIFEISGVAEKGIVLKNIDLNDITIIQEVNKYDEEIKEFNEAFYEYTVHETIENKEHLIEEYFDVLQSMLGLLDKLGITAQEVMQEYPKHLEKIKDRPRVKEDKYEQ